TPSMGISAATTTADGWATSHWGCLTGDDAFHGWVGEISAETGIEVGEVDLASRMSFARW
ncbi:MAG: hypothetical protein ACKPKO_48405, partial [Candidatus Fonsibacter sp.]